MLEMILEKLEGLGEDVEVVVCGKKVAVVVQDFDGFDDDWCEVDRQYDEDSVDEVLSWLAEKADRVEGDFYSYYFFEDLVVSVGYASFDI
jgi:hypothetical protein